MQLYTACDEDSVLHCRRHLKGVDWGSTSRMHVPGFLALLSWNVLSEAPVRFEFSWYILDEVGLA
jgi:hypothetical protein